MMQKNDQYIAYNGTVFDSEEKCIYYEKIHIIMDYADGIRFFSSNLDDSNLEFCSDLSTVIHKAYLCHIINAARAQEMIAVLYSWHDPHINECFPSYTVCEDDNVLIYHYKHQEWEPREEYAELYDLLTKAFSLGK